MGCVPSRPSFPLPFKPLEESTPYEEYARSRNHADVSISLSKDEKAQGQKTIMEVTHTPATAKVYLRVYEEEMRQKKEKVDRRIFVANAAVKGYQVEFDRNERTPRF